MAHHYYQQENQQRSASSSPFPRPPPPGTYPHQQSQPYRSQYQHHQAPPNHQYSSNIQQTPSPAPPAFSNHYVSRSFHPPPPSSNPASPSFAQTSFNHPLAVQDINLEPPQRSFVIVDRPLSSASTERPTSVASFSNISTHSNEPLNPRGDQSAPDSTRKPKKGLKGYQNQPMQSGRAITPQPWHPDYSRSPTPNPLDLPEHRRNGSGDSHGLEEIDLDDRDEKNSGPVLNKTRKNFFSRLARGRTKKRIKYERTGKLARFSNERLYLHWIRFGILQGSIAVMLLSFGLELASYIGIGSLMLAMITLIYATTLYHLRHLYMVAKRDDIVYYARTIPTLLTIALFVLYGANFILAFSIGEEARSPPPWTRYDTGFHFG